MPTRNAAATKARILQTAKKVFSEIGYDGARIDDIARRAHVNKALIYYYFESKEHLLEHVYEEFLEHVRSQINAVAQAPEGLLDDQAITRYFERTLAFLEENEDLLRIIMMESLKKNASSPLVLRGMEAWQGEQMRVLIEKFSRAGVNIDKNMSQLMVTEFFTNSMPVVMFVLLNQHWEKRHHISAEELRRQFIAAMRQTHVHHHRHQMGTAKGRAG